MINLKKMSLLIAVISTAIFFSCTPEEKEIQDLKLHFDIVTLLDNQVKVLDSLNPSLSKVVKFQNDSSKILKEELDWAKELEMFYEMDINKPALAPLYDSVLGKN
jgi:hypothetical protein